MNATSALKLGAKANGRGQFDDGGLVGDFLCLLDRGFDALEIMVTVLDVLGVPAVRFETFQDIFGECALCVTICSC